MNFTVLTTLYFDLQHLWFLISFVCHLFIFLAEKSGNKTTFTKQHFEVTARNIIDIFFQQRVFPLHVACNTFSFNNFSALASESCNVLRTTFLLSLINATTFQNLIYKILHSKLHNKHSRKDAKKGVIFRAVSFY